MKKIILVFTVLFFTLSCWSQTVSKTINIDVPGSLSTNLTATEKATITDLTVTGSIDARDFKTMRDNMPLLANLDISTVVINAFTGTGGTMNLNTSYPVNELPQRAFYYKATIKDFKLPNSISSIGDRALYECYGLTRDLTIPDNVVTVGDYAFCMCFNITGTLYIGKNLQSFGKYAFTNLENTSGTYTIISSIVVSPENLNFSSKDGVLYNKDLTKLILCPQAKSGAITIPNSVVEIGASAFGHCRKLTGDIFIPESVTSIGSLAFWGCNLTRFFVANSTPPVCQSYFDLGVNPSQFMLFVPKGSKAAYQAAPYWSVFTTIVEQDFADNTAVNELSESALSVYGRSNEIVVAGASAGQIIQVYSLMGLLLKTVKTTSELTIIPVDKGGVYLINVSGRVAKVVR